MKRWEYVKIAVSSLFFIAILLLVSTIFFPKLFPGIASSLKKFMESCDVKLKGMFKRELKDEDDAGDEDRAREKAAELLLELDQESGPPYYDNFISLN